MRRTSQLTALFCSLSLLAVVQVPGAQAAAQINDDDETAVAVYSGSPEVQALMEKGDDLVAEGKYGPARREYSRAADLMRADGLVPERPLRRIAYSHYYQGRYQSAVDVLEELAEEANQYGDLATRVWAIADAAWIEGIAGYDIDLKRRLATLDKLLGSPFLPDGVRQEVIDKRLRNSEIWALSVTGQ